MLHADCKLIPVFWETQIRPSHTSVFSTQTDSGCPALTSPSTQEPFTGDAGDETWNLMHGKRVLHSWAMKYFGSIFHGMIGGGGGVANGCIYRLPGF